MSITVQCRSGLSRQLVDSLYLVVLMLLLTCRIIFNVLVDASSLCMETEQIGNMTLDQMGRQREQLEGANANISATIQVARQAKEILNQM